MPRIPRTEPPSAPIPEQPQVHTPPAPRMKRIERQGNRSEPYSRRYPNVNSGICEFCGVLDPHYPSIEQYKLCPHYRGMQLACTYCPENKNPDDVIYHSTLHVQENPNNPDVLVVWCDSYECSKAHTERWKLSAV